MYTGKQVKLDIYIRLKDRAKDIIRIRNKMKLLNIIKRYSSIGKSLFHELKEGQGFESSLYYRRLSACPCDG